MLRVFSLLTLFSVLVFGSVPVAEHTISQSNKTFSQAELTIKPGDKVVFKNDDNVTHNVFSVSKGAEFNLKTQAPGTANAVPFNNEGTVEIRCAIHPKMKLIVNVKR